MYSVHSFWTTHSQPGSSSSGRSELKVQPFPAPWQSMTTISVAPARARAPDGRVDLLRVELAPLLVERLAAVDLLPLDDAGDALHVADDEDAHRGSTISPATTLSRDGAHDGRLAERRGSDARRRLGRGGRARVRLSSDDGARQRMVAARAFVDEAAGPRGRAHLRHQHRLRPLRRAHDPARALRGAPASAAPKPCVRGGGALPRRGRPRRDAPPRQHAGEGLLGRARRDRRAPPRVPEPWRAPVVPSRGSVGASGDLAPLAHLALPLVGEGWAVVDGEPLDRGGGARARRTRAGPPRRPRRGCRSSTARSS